MCEVRYGNCTWSWMHYKHHNDYTTTTLLINLGFHMPTKSSVKSSTVIPSYLIQISIAAYRGQ